MEYTKHNPTTTIVIIPILRNRALVPESMFRRDSLIAMVLLRMLGHTQLGKMTMEGASTDAEFFCRKGAVSGAFLKGLADHARLHAGKVQFTDRTPFNRG
jgi:acetoacetate decarboxylase